MTRDLPAHLRALLPDGARPSDGGQPAERGATDLAGAGFRRDFVIPRTIPVMVREGSTADWADIWPFFRLLLAAGDTLCLPNIMMGSDARQLWFGGADTEVLVALDPRDKPIVENPDSPILGRIIGSASLRTARDGHGRHVAHAAVVVDPALAGQGVERELGISVLARARAAGFRAVEIGPVVAADTAALDSWLSLGFTIVGTVPEAFSHPRDGDVALHYLHRTV